ncbi:MAG: patatin family protein, partial [Pseudobutyrivibrio sp.]|nr:patatin family protein [Pseudobutyrivibrio sp.]
FPKAAASLLKKYPKVADRMLSRHLMYNNELAILRQYEREGTAFIICPSKPITISKTEKDETKLQEVYDLGREDCQRLIDEIRGFLVEIAVRLC